VVKKFSGQSDGAAFSDSGRPQAILFANSIKCAALVRRFSVRVFSLLVLCVVCLAQNDSRIPPEVRYKRGYVNPVRKPPEFTSGMLWGIAIADTRIPGYEHAQVEIQQTRLTCSVDGKDVILTTTLARSEAVFIAVSRGSGPMLTMRFRWRIRKTIMQ
jgi:hypothetical protein